MKALNKACIRIDDIDRVIEKECEGKEKEKIKTYLYKKYTGLKNKEIIERIWGREMHSSTVSKIVSRIEEERREDKKYDKKLTGLEGKMSISRSDP